VDAGKFDAAPSPRQVTSHRGLLGYTGTTRRPVSVQTSGMGAPSMSIVVEELLRLGARRLIRVGTCGGIGRGIKTGEIVIASAAAPVDGATRTYLHGDPTRPRPTSAWFGRLWKRPSAAARNPTSARSRRSMSSTTRRGLLLQMARSRRPRLRDGDLGPVLPGGAAKAAGADVAAATILTVSDVLSEEVSSEESYLPLDELNRSIERTIEIALERTSA